MYIKLLNRLHYLRRRIHSRLLRHCGGFASCGAINVDPGVRIDNPQGMRLDDGVLILRGAWLYCLPWAEGPVPELWLGTGTYIGYYSHISCARRVHIAPGCLLANHVYIADCDHQYQDIHTYPIRQPMIHGAIEIGEGTWIGEHACVFGKVTIGRHCVVGANSVVCNRTIPDYCVVVGAPARIVKRFDPLSRTWRRTLPDGAFQLMEKNKEHEAR
jgi:carbonic anhydrase/acetyltransferase-like protein (isoleucine patch superfamily)